MPIYAYRCAECGAHKDILQKLSDPPATECPSCGKPALEKQVTAAGFQLKGSGWYATDFKNSGSKPAESKDSKGSADSKPAESGDSATKAAAPEAASATPAPAVPANR
jgi:putative FmdB family regulatory protein